MALLLVFGINADESKAFNNPLNNRAVDLFLVVDEGNSYVNVLQLGLIKTAIQNLVTDLNPSASNPSFSVIFYGATSGVNTIVSKATSASAVKTALDRKQYAAAHSIPSTLVTALSTVSTNCQSNCRLGVSRVTVVISSTPDSSAEATIRQLERNHGMTVIVVGVGFTATTTILNRLASHPTRFYAISVTSFYELILVAPHIASMVSDVPRLIDFNSPLYISSISINTYYTVQLNTYSYTTTNDTIVMFASNCPTCSVYGSLSEPNPIVGNTIANTRRHSFYAASGYPNSLYYFRIPKNTGRFYISLLGNGMSGVYILLNVFPLPDMMGISPRNFQATDSFAILG